MLEFIGISPQLVIDGLQAAGCLCVFQHHISGLISVCDWFMGTRLMCFALSIQLDVVNVDIAS
jgi:hypothetical protein